MNPLARLRRLLVSTLRRSIEKRGAVIVPAPCLPLWHAFSDLSRTRAVGPLGPNPITYAEIEAWCRLKRVPLEPSHVSILIEMDQVWLEHVFNKRSNAPEGAKTLPPRSEHKLTPAVFDLALG